MKNQNENEESAKWLAVIGRSLAFLSLGQADLRDKSLATQTVFLESLGLPRKECANLLGTTPQSLTELLRLERKKKKGNRNGKKQK